MATFLQLQDEVKANIIDLPTAVVNVVPSLIIRAMRKLQEQHNFKVMEGQQSFVTTLATRVLGAVASDFKEARGLPWETADEDGMVRKLIYAPRREAIWPAIHEEDEGRPLIILDGQPNSAGTRSYEVYPLPDGNSDYTDGEYRITIPYWKYLPDLSANGDTNWFTVHAEEYLLFQATADGFVKDWDEERALFWTQLAQAKYRDVLNLDKRQRFAEVDTLVPHWRGAADNNLSW